MASMATLDRDFDEMVGALQGIRSQYTTKGTLKQVEQEVDKLENRIFFAASKARDVRFGGEDVAGAQQMVEDSKAAMRAADKMETRIRRINKALAEIREIAMYWDDQ